MTSSALPGIAAARAQSFLMAISKRHQGVWDQVDGVRQLIRETGSWDQRCYLPHNSLLFEFADPFPVRGRYNRPPLAEQRKRLNDSSIIAGLAAWRLTKGIFLLQDADISEAKSVGVPLDADWKVFLSLPHQCVYVPTPGFTWLGALLHGFFAYIDVASNGELSMVLLLDRDDQLYHSLTDVITVRLEYRIHVPKQPMVSRDDIIRNWSKAATDWSKMCRRNLFHTPIMIDFQRKTAKQSDRGEGASNTEMWNVLEEYLVQDILPIAGILYRICEVTSHIPPAGRPRYPKPVRTSAGYRMQPADEVGIWDVDLRMRTLRKRNGKEWARKCVGGRPGNRKRTHARNAHFRTLSDGRRTFVSPAIVNPKDMDPDDRPSTVIIIPEKEI